MWGYPSETRTILKQTNTALRYIKPLSHQMAIPQRLYSVLRCGVAEKNA